MAGPDWASWADRDGRAWTTNPMSGSTGARRVGLHWTASPATASPKSQADYMAANAGLNTGYHLLVPIIDNGYRPLQLRPFSKAAGSFYNSGQLARSPNKEGTVGIQIAMICTTGDDPFTRGPGPWWPQVLDLLDAWGIPRQYVWHAWNASEVMPTSVWYSANSGYTAHKQVPEVPGVVRKPDPGPVTDSVLWSGAYVPAPIPPPSPSDGFTLVYA
jgi:hypothetical protein